MHHGGIGLARWLMSAGIIILALVTAACGRYLDPGPEPARLTITVQARTDAQRVDERVLDRLGPPPYTPGGFHWLAPQPVWDWGVYLVRGERDLRPLQPLPPAQVESAPGFGLKQTATFLAPPGKGLYRVLAEAFLEHTWHEGGPWREYIPIASHQMDMELDLKPSEERQRVVLFEPFQPVD